MDNNAEHTILAKLHIICCEAHLSCIVSHRKQQLGLNSITILLLDMYCVKKITILLFIMEFTCLWIDCSIKDFISQLTIFLGYGNS